MEQFSFYVIFESSIIGDKSLTSTDKLLYAYISGLSLKSGKCFARNKFLAKLLNISLRQVQRSLEKLKHKKYILIEIKDNKRIIMPSINKFVELRATQPDQLNKVFENIDFDWLNGDESNG